MNEEVYEALKRLVRVLGEIPAKDKPFVQNDLNLVESWIDEVAKEYEEGGEQYE